MRVVSVEEGSVRAELPVREELFAPNGFLHAGAVVTLADTCAGYPNNGPGMEIRARLNGPTFS